MHRRTNHSHHWAVVLAGGDGERLRPLTSLVSGDDRPKQFCALLPGGRTLLQETEARIAKAIEPSRTVFVLNRQHERYYADELRTVSPARMAVQPANRGTLAAIIYSLARVMRLDDEAMVGFFPSDHHYAREDRFVAGIRVAFDAAESDRNRVILLGAMARSPETSYGYIEPGARITGSDDRLKQVVRFWEKPPERLARSLIAGGCLWNTFVMVGRARAFLDLVRRATSEAYFSAFEPLFSKVPSGREAEALDTIYHLAPPADFSKCVLSNACDQLGVLNLGRIGWSDLGEPQRLLALFTQREMWPQELVLEPAAVSDAAAWTAGLKPSFRDHACAV